MTAAPTGSAPPSNYASFEAWTEPSLCSPSAGSSIDARTNLTEFVDRVVVRINAARRTHGLRPVRHMDSCIDRFYEQSGRHLADTDRDRNAECGHRP
jgi:hypothetical protein